MGEITCENVTYETVCRNLVWVFYHLRRGLLLDDIHAPPFSVGRLLPLIVITTPFFPRPIVTSVKSYNSGHMTVSRSVSEGLGPPGTHVCFLDVS